MQCASEFKVLLRLYQSQREPCVLLAVFASQQCHLIAGVFLSRRKSFHCSFGTITKGYNKLMFCSAVGVVSQLTASGLVYSL